MDRYIGLDADASSCTMAVVSPGGKRLGSQVVETNVRCLIEAVRQIPTPRHICLEEGTLSEWLYEVLSPHAEEVAGKAVYTVKSCPGLGPVSTAELLPIVVTPFRFQNKRGVLVPLLQQGGGQPYLARFSQ